MMWQNENDPHAGMKAAGLYTEEDDYDDDETHDDDDYDDDDYDHPDQYAPAAVGGEPFAVLTTADERRVIVGDPLRDMASDELYRLRARLVHEASAVASRPGFSFPSSDDWGADFVEYNDIHRRINECEAALYKLGRTL